MAPRKAQQRGLEARWQDEKERELWYSGGAAYWSNTAETNDGVLGGFGLVHKADTADSIKFAQRCGVPPSERKGGPRKLCALDVGAGIGRVTGGALLELADTVDLVEARAHDCPCRARPRALSGGGMRPQACDKFVERAKVDLAWAAPRVERFICEPMQNFTPEPGRYNLIWIQWCIGCLTDDDLVAFMSRCRDALAPDGLIIIKDNVIDAPTSGMVSGKYLIDHEDNSVIRTMAHLETLVYKRSGLQPVSRAEAVLGRDDLHPVYNLALKPAD